MQPIQLEPNIMERPYRGGIKLAQFRGVPDLGDYHPEDWIGSTTSMYTEEKLGLTYLEDGRTLKEAIESDPKSFLGPDHIEKYGPDPGILVKLLDAGERLSVQCHPDREFAQQYLSSKYGKAEAWFILDTYGDEPCVYLGFKKEIRKDDLAKMVREQDRSALRDLLNRLDVEPGDRVFVPGGVPHAIGEGILLIEIQEPSDILLRLEWAGYKVGGFSSDMGLGLDKALECVDCSAYGEDRVADLWIREGDHRADQKSPYIYSLLPYEADTYFRLEKIDSTSSVPLSKEYSILIVINGEGTLQTDPEKALQLRRGDSVLIPWAAGQVSLHGDIQAIRCLPPR